jgi:hypothetical protein
MAVLFGVPIGSPKWLAVVHGCWSRVCLFVGIAACPCGPVHSNGTVDAMRAGTRVPRRSFVF